MSKHYSKLYLENEDLTLFPSTLGKNLYTNKS